MGSDAEIGALLADCFDLEGRAHEQPATDLRIVVAPRLLFRQQIVVAVLVAQLLRA